jgi:hypothetical protein
VCWSKRRTCRGCGRRNLCHQAIFVNHASCTVTPLYPEMGQVGDAVGQRAERRGLVQGSVRPVRGVEVLAAWGLEDLAGLLFGHGA